MVQKQFYESKSKELSIYNNWKKSRPNVALKVYCHY